MITPTPRKKIIVIGNAVADVVAFPVDDVPRTGSLHPDKVAYFSGGCANNSVLAMAKLNADVTLIACVGRDVFGDALIAEWQRVGINTEYVIRHPTEPTGVTIVLVDSGGERRFISTPAANRFLSLDHVPLSVLNDAYAVQLAGFFTFPGLEDGKLIPFLQAAQERGVLTVVDPVGGSAYERREHLLELVPYLDLVLVNEDEGHKITDATEADEIAARLMSRGASSVIVKLSDQGSQVYGELGPLPVPAFPVTTVDTTGAGDAYVAALLTSLARGDDFPTATRWASAAGAATVQHLGAQGAWTGWHDLAQIANG